MFKMCGKRGENTEIFKPTKAFHFSFHTILSQKNVLTAIYQGKNEQTKI